MAPHMVETFLWRLVAGRLVDDRHIHACIAELGAEILRHGMPIKE